jgi:hypothetical protein
MLLASQFMNMNSNQQMKSFDKAHRDKRKPRQKHPSRISTLTEREIDTAIPTNELSARSTSNRIPLSLMQNANQSTWTAREA